MVLVQKEIKKVYLGNTLVRPNSYNFSYNLIGKTVALMEADGWSFLDSNKAIFNTNGLSTNTQDIPAFPYIDVTSIIPNAKKITITYNGVYQNKFRCGFGLFKSLGDVSVSANCYTGLFLTAAEVLACYSIAGNFVTSSRTISGTISTTFIADLENGTWTGTATNGYSVSGTISASDITKIRNETNYMAIRADWGGGGNSSGGVSSIDISIKY